MSPKLLGLVSDSRISLRRYQKCRLRPTSFQPNKFLSATSKKRETSSSRRKTLMQIFRRKHETAANAAAGTHPKSIQDTPQQTMFFFFWGGGGNPCSNLTLKAVELDAGEMSVLSCFDVLTQAGFLQMRATRCSTTPRSGLDFSLG